MEAQWITGMSSVSGSKGSRFKPQQRLNIYLTRNDADGIFEIQNKY